MLLEVCLIVNSANCDASGSKLSAGVELPAAAELQRSEVNTTLMKNVTEDSHIETSAVQDEVTLASYQQRSAVARVHGSGGYSQTAGESGLTYCSSAVPLSDNQQYSFRYHSLMQ